MRLQGRYNIIDAEGVASDQVSSAIRELILDWSALFALSILEFFNTVGNIELLLQLIGEGPVSPHEMATGLLP